MSNLEKIFDFLYQAARLKKVLRYKEHNKALSESSADHSWNLALMTLILEKELNLRIDINHAIKIALIHDIVELIHFGSKYNLESTSR